jgi:hypothetical protein
MIHLETVRRLFAVGTLVALGAGCMAGPDSEPESAETEAELARRCGKQGSLYISDIGDNSVKRFNALTGEYQGLFVKPESGGLLGPQGLIFGHRELLLSNQNVDQPFPGEILSYLRRNGAFSEALVPHTDPHAPYAPRGLVKAGHRLHVADVGDPAYLLGGGLPPNPNPGRLAVYDERSGKWLHDLPYEGFLETCTGDGCEQWAPRGVVFGPDGALYVSLMKFTSADDPNTLPGRIIRFKNNEVSVFIDGEHCSGCGLARPEGLVFGPDGRLYVTSFRKSAEETDKILIFNGRTGAFEDRIDFNLVTEPRAFAQALVFGPGNKLFVPMNGAIPNAGSVRRYDVNLKTYELFVAGSTAETPSPLIAPRYLTFDRTNPSTLLYR